MSRRGRLAVAAGVIIVILITLEVLVGSIEFAPQGRIIEKKLSAAIGRDVRICGDLHLGLLPDLRFEATNVTVSNLPGRSSPHLLEIGILRAELSPWELAFGVVEIDGVDLIDADISIETDAEGGFSLGHDLTSLTDESGNEPMQFRLRSLDIDDLRVFYRRSDTETVTTMRLDSLSMEAGSLDEPVTLTALGELDGGSFDITGRFGPLQEFFHPTAPYPLSLRGRIFEAEVEAEGTVETPLALRGIDVGISAVIPNLARLSRDPGRDLSRIGPLTVEGRLTNPNATLGVEALTISTKHSSSVRAEVTGSVKDLARFRGIELEVGLEADDLSFLDHFVEQRLPELSVTASASVSDRDGSLGVEGTVHAVAPDGRLSVEVTGGHGNLSLIDELDLRVDARARDLRAIGELLEIQLQLPAIGPVTASGRLRDHNGAVSLDELDLKLGRGDDTWAEVKGSLEDVFQLDGVRLTAEFGAANLRHASTYLARKPPDVGPLRGAATLTDRDGTLGVEVFTLRGGREGLFEIDLSGSFDDVREIDEIGVEARLRARDLGVIGGLVGADLPPIAPVEFAGRVRGSDEQFFAEGTVRLDKTRFRGEASGSFPSGKRPRLDARLESPHLHLDDVGIEPRSDPQGRAARGLSVGVTGSPSPWWSSSEPLPLEWLRALDAQVDLRAERVSGRSGLDVQEVHGSIRLEDGHLTVSRGHGIYEGGALEAELQVDAQTPVPRIALGFDATGVDLKRLMSQLEQETAHSGFLDGWVQLESRGRSPNALMASLSGDGGFAVRDGTAAGRYARAFVMNFVRTAFPSLGLRQEAPHVDCFLVDLGIDDGVATVKRLVLTERDITVTGAGEIDFTGDAYNLTLTPKTRNPGLISVAAQVEVTGPLLDPVFTPVNRTIATSVVRGLLANAMRPAQAVLSPFRGAPGADESICANPPRPPIASGFRSEGK